jgi:hypothetical protein
MAYIGNSNSIQQYSPTISYFNGNGSTTAFTLPIPVASSAQIIVTVENVIQNPATAFTASGSTLTFTSAPPSGTNNIWVEYTSLQTNAIAPTQGTVQNSSFGSVTSIPFVTGGPLGGGNSSIMKNRIINGGCVIDQRNSGASVTIPATASTYTVDRWTAYGSQASKFTVQQNAGTVTPPAGFTNYLGVTSLSAYSVGAAETFTVRQYIEGYNVADLNFGTANAATVTLSFWVRSSLTGSFGGVFWDGNAGTSFYPFSYTISAANTWQQISITIAGRTSGTWATNNAAGACVQFQMATGSNYLGTANTWSSSTILAPTGSTNIIGTNGATFYITGVQLEVGSSATGYEYRQYQQELALCQRYFQKYNDGVSYYPYSIGNWINTTFASCIRPLVVTMRSAPSFTFTNPTNTLINNGATPYSATSIAQDILASDVVMYSVTVSSGGTAGYCTRHYQNSTNSSNLLLSAEL